MTEQNTASTGCSWVNRPGCEGERTVLENGPQPAALASTFRPVPFSLTLAPGVQIQASRDGLQTNLGPRARRVYVGQQFANPAIPAAPLTFYVPSRARREHPSYLAPQLPPTADKAQQAQALVSAIEGIRTLHHQDFPQSRGWSFRTRPARPRRHTAATYERCAGTGEYLPSLDTQGCDRPPPC